MNAFLTIAALVSIAMLAIDWWQTLAIARQPDSFYETNIILGKHPSAARVSCYFAVCIAVLGALIGIAWLCGRTHVAMAIALVVATFEAVVVVRNLLLGVR